MEVYVGQQVLSGNLAIVQRQLQRFVEVALYDSLVSDDHVASQGVGFVFDDRVAEVAGSFKQIVALFLREHVVGRPSAERAAQVVVVDAVGCVHAGRIGLFQ